jgi:hypothetical protein
MSDTTTVPAGWYADPTGDRGQRWWDGLHWTGHVQPAPFEMSRTPQAAPVARWNWGFGTVAGDLATGRNTPAFHALILGLIGLVASPLLLASVGAVGYGVAGWVRAGSLRGDMRRGPSRGRGGVMAVTAVLLGLIGLFAFFS